MCQAPPVTEEASNNATGWGTEVSSTPQVLAGAPSSNKKPVRGASGAINLPEASPPFRAGQVAPHPNCPHAVQ